MEHETEKKTERRRDAIRREVREKTMGYLLTALGLVAGLAWNDAVSALIKQLFPLDQNGVVAKFIYAVVITVAVVIVSSSLLRINERTTK